MESKKNTLLGRILSTVRTERQLARDKAVTELWKRNNLANPTKRDGYRMAETSTVSRDGTEVTEYRLYKLIDRALVTTSSKIATDVKYGQEAALDDD